MLKSTDEVMDGVEAEALLSEERQQQQQQPSGDDGPSATSNGSAPAAVDSARAIDALSASLSTLRHRSARTATVVGATAARIARQIHKSFTAPSESDLYLSSGGKKQSHNGIVVLAAPLSTRRKRLQDRRRKILLAAVAVFCLLVYLLSSPRKTADGPASGNANERPLSDSHVSKDKQNVTSKDRSKIKSTVAVPSDKSSATAAEPKLVVLGERHSGVDWWIESLRKCFPDVAVRDGLTRTTPFFQNYSAVDTRDPDNLNLHVILTTLDPYNWTERMRLQPIYAQNHWNAIDNRPLEWDVFVAKRWNMRRPSSDIRAKERATKPLRCQHNFTYSKILPCKKSSSAYELTLDKGKPFDSILDLRTSKFLNFIDVQQYATSFQIVPFERISSSRSEFRKYIRAISRLMDKNTHDGCKFEADGTSAPDATAYALSKNYIRYINDHLDWTIENKVGYRPREQTDSQSSSDESSESSESSSSADESDTQSSESVDSADESDTQSSDANDESSASTSGSNKGQGDSSESSSVDEEGSSIESDSEDSQSDTASDESDSDTASDESDSDENISSSNEDNSSDTDESSESGSESKSGDTSESSDNSESDEAESEVSTSDSDSGDDSESSSSSDRRGRRVRLVRL